MPYPRSATARADALILGNASPYALLYVLSYAVVCWFLLIPVSAFASSQSLFSFEYSNAYEKANALVENQSQYKQAKVAKVATAQQNTGIRLRLNTDVLSALSLGDQQTLNLPDGRVVNTTVVRRRKGAQSRTVLSIEGGKGSIELREPAQGAYQLRISDLRSEFKLYEINVDDSNAGEVLAIDPSTKFCMNYPLANNIQKASFSQAFSPSTPSILAATPSEAELKLLQSKPNANHVLYLNFWGGSLSGTKWNDDFNSGAAIAYTKYSFDGDTANFSTIDLDRIWLAWREVLEDYAPFDVNITTSQAVYDAAAAADRAMVIATTSSVWFGSMPGGIAYTPSFGDDYVGVGWVWNANEITLGVTLSHEAGHQMGLLHDGQGSDEYYAGHDGATEPFYWGPIMGVSGGYLYTQWSKGEYFDATNTEDDLAIIESVLKAQADVVGGTTLTAYDISSSSSVDASIEPEGLGGGVDTDVYRFTVPSLQNVTVDVAPILGAEGETYGTDLSLYAELRDASSQIAESNTVPTGVAATNVLQYNGNLAAGSYTVAIKARSSDSNFFTGYSEYANAGLYRLSVSSSVIEPDLTSQISAPKTNLSVKESINLRSEIENIANPNMAANAVATTLRFYQSSDSTISTGDTELAATAVLALAGQESDFVTATVLMPETSGTYWLGACVDAVVNETVLSNNCSAGLEVNVADDSLCFPVKTQAGKVALICL